MGSQKVRYNLATEQQQQLWRHLSFWHLPYSVQGSEMEVLIRCLKVYNTCGLRLGEEDKTYGRHIHSQRTKRKCLGLRRSSRVLSGPVLGSRVHKVTCLLAACLPVILRAWEALKKGFPSLPEGQRLLPVLQHLCPYEKREHHWGLYGAGVLHAFQLQIFFPETQTWAAGYTSTTEGVKLEGTDSDLLCPIPLNLFIS